VAAIFRLRFPCDQDARALLMMNLTTKQFGDACEYAVLAEISFAGLPATKMPDGWPGYDLMVGGRPDGRISVKGLRHTGKPGGSRFWRFKPEGWDWLALIRFNEDQTRSIYIAPHEWALSVARRGNDGLCDLYGSTSELENFRDNFRLERRETPWTDAKAEVLSRVRRRAVSHEGGDKNLPPWRSPLSEP
jgi:hypothetical protein